jgi:hypothetical protein
MCCVHLWITKGQFEGPRQKGSTPKIIRVSTYAYETPFSTMHGALLLGPSLSTSGAPMPHNYPLHPNVTATPNAMATFLS